MLKGCELRKVSKQKPYTCQFGEFRGDLNYVELDNLQIDNAA